MQLFTIYRAIFLVFIIVLAIYIIMENNKSKIETKLEKYIDAPTTTKSPATLPATLPATQTQNNIQNLKNTPPGYDKAASTQPNKPSVVIPTPSPNVIDKTNKTEIQKYITQAYTELYNTPPSQQELDFYTDFVSNRNLTYEQLKGTIDSSAPTLKNTFLQNTSKYAKNSELIVYGTEPTVIDIYNELLMRNPDQDELSSNAKLMKNDKKFTQDKLRQLLIASEEYKRMQKTQTNQVYMNLQGNITDRQLTMQVMAIYKNVTKKDYLDEDTMKFLKRKFVEFKLDEATLTKFITNYITPLDAATTKQDTKTDADTDSTSGVTPDTPQPSAPPGPPPGVTPPSVPPPSAKPNVKENFNNNRLETADGRNVYYDSKILNFYGNNVPNNDILQNLLKGDSMAGNTGVIDTIKNNSQCAMTKYATNSSDVNLANFVADRNNQELGSACARSKTYINADENMVLYPEFKWSVPQKNPPVCVGGNANYNPMVEQTSLIGTLLGDSKNTQVGSILPMIPPS